MSRSTIRVLVVDDHDVVRAGILALFSEVEDIEVVGEAGNGLQAIEQADRLKPDVILMDLVMPQLNGIEAIRQISAQHPQTRLLVMTSYSGDDMVFPAIKAGAQGFLLKDTKPAELVRAIRQVQRGEPSLHPSIARKLVEEVIRPAPPPRPTPEPLTEREAEVLRLVAGGLENQQIAGQLSITEVTVRSHVSHILAKLHLANRVQATLYALREGLTTLDDDVEGGG